MSQPFQVAQVFTGYEGKLVSLKDTVRSFKEILSGQHDSLPESAFYMVCTLYCLTRREHFLNRFSQAGTIEDVKAKAEQLAKDMAN